MSEPLKEPAEGPKAWLRAAVVSAIVAAPTAGGSAYLGAAGLPPRVQAVEERVQALEQRAVAADTKQAELSRKVDRLQRWQDKQDERIRDFYEDPFADLKERLKAIETNMRMLLDGARVKLDDGRSRRR